MNRIVFSVILLFASGISSAQVLSPAKWSWKASATSVKVGDEIDLIFNVTVDDNWYVYANDFDPDCGPLLTTITLNDHPGFKTVGSFRAIKSKDKHDEIFGCDVKLFVGKGEFRQRIKVLSPDLKISGVIEGQT
ncbi:MAG TPA: protein-disulfide reductase DsbD domain-containing protein, partial [Cyclobacteriaceae bacterium]|nr:protein-disulfide reductase DsbD domain-containing protein [Cyclobacteriaceae bacterium]